MATATRHQRPKQPPMTAAQAQTFERYSMLNAAMAAMALQESGACPGSCHPYKDIYTYNRWKALGYQVQRGQHGARLGIILHTTEEDDGKVITKSRPWHTTVFCRHQVTLLQS